MHYRSPYSLPAGAGWVSLAMWLVALSAVAHPGIDEQISDLTVRIAAAPRDADLYVRRAELHRIHRDWEMAAADLSRATECEPGRSDVQFYRGRLFLDTDRADLALAALDIFLRTDPTSTRGLEARAGAYGELGRHLDAARDLTAVINGAGSGKAGPGLYLDRARQLAAAGERNLDAAIRGLDEGIAALGGPVTLELYAIDLELRLGRFDPALARLARVAERAERKESWHVRQGEVLEAAGRPDEAAAAYRAALVEIEQTKAGRRGSSAVARLEGQARDAVTRLEGRAN